MLPSPLLPIDFEKILNLSQEWMESKEFIEKYIQTNHPYPPLLNPKLLKDKLSDLNYKNIPPDFSWESNLPLPTGYKFLFVMMSHSGHTSMVYYLKKCGVSIMQDHIFNVRKNYLFGYDALLKNEPTILNFTAYSTAGNDYFNELEKYLYLVNPKTPVLCLVRDPVPRLKVSLNNHLGRDYFGIEKLQYHFSENDNLQGFENRFIYLLAPNKSFKDRVEYSLTKNNTFRYSDLYEKMLALGFHHFDFLDIQNIIEPADIFDLMMTLSKIYDFPPPKDIADFNFRTKRSYYCLLPMIHEVRNVPFLITPDVPMPNINGDVEVSKILDLDLSWFNQFESGIYVYIRKDDLEIVHQNLEFIKTKINIFIDKIKETMINEEKKLTDEYELLEFFKTHPRHRQMFWKVIQKEVGLVKEKRPDIVQTWQYYLEFEKICKSLDGV